MKTAVTAKEPEITAPLDSRFGRAAWFLIVDEETHQWKTIENSQNRSSAQGAGIQAARTIIDSGAGVLISGDVGPKAFQVLHAADVRMFRADTALYKTVADALEAWRRGELEAIQAATVEGHSI